jgi:hypothetical protein
MKTSLVQLVLLGLLSLVFALVASEGTCSAGDDESCVPVPPTRPAPQLFAIMRNGHEVLRGLMADMNAFLAEKDMFSFASTWQVFYRWVVFTSTNGTFNTRA